MVATKFEFDKLVRKKVNFKIIVSSIFFVTGSSVYAVVPNINQCDTRPINAEPEILYTDTQINYEKSLSSILSELRSALGANIVNNPQNICHVLQIKTDTDPNSVIKLYIDHMNAYLYAVTVTQNNGTSYYGDPAFLQPIPNNKYTFNIEYNPYTQNYLNSRSAQKLGMEIQNQNNMDHAKNMFFNSLTILEASKMPSIEVAMTNPNLWNVNAPDNLLNAKKNYLQQYKCSRWQINEGQTTPELKYTYLMQNQNNLNDGIKATYDLTQWYSKCGTSAKNCMSYITPSYAPQGSRNIPIDGHPCTK